MGTLGEAPEVMDRLDSSLLQVTDPYRVEVEGKGRRILPRAEVTDKRVSSRLPSMDRVEVEVRDLSPHLQTEQLVRQINNPLQPTDLVEDRTKA
jgi:hypothetical protein